MSEKALLEKRSDRIAVITLNRPEALNAIDRDMTRALRAAIRDIETDDGIDVMLVTGAASKAFCVGVDLKERQVLSDAEAEAYRAGELFPMYEEFDHKTKPSIALVDGHCLAGGFELALTCDLILATPRSTFGLPETRWGLIPAAGGCRKLPKLIGAARAKEIILTARSFDAETALRFGVINRIVPAKDLRTAGEDLARAIMANKQVAVRAAKRAVDFTLDLDRAAAFDIELANACYADKERKDGVAAFSASKPASN
jgi:enoyl-CoA hydratase/carnithine racemase